MHRGAMAVPKVVQPTPSWLKSYAVIFSSLLAGASIVHNILKPDLTIPTLDSTTITERGVPNGSQNLDVKKLSPS